MAVTRTTSFSSGAVISNVAGRVSAIHIDQAEDGQTSTTFVMLYDKATAPSGGTDTPVFVYQVDTQALQGNRGRLKIMFPAGGHRYGTGVGLFVATAFNGATGATTTAPTSVDVFYETGN
jgi:hypothetical protein